MEVTSLKVGHRVSLSGVNGRTKVGDPRTCLRNGLEAGRATRAVRMR